MRTMLSIFIVFLLVVFLGCQEDEIFYIPELNRFVRAISLIVFEPFGEVATVYCETHEKTRNWGWYSIIARQGILYPQTPKTLAWDVFSVQATKPIKTGLLDIPIKITNGGWNDQVKLALDGNLPPGWKVTLMPWRTRADQKKIRLEGPVVEFISGELMRIYTTAGTDLQIEENNSSEADHLMQELLFSIAVTPDSSVVVYEQTIDIRLNEPTNQVEVEFGFLDRTDKLLAAKVGSMFFYGKITDYSPNEPPISQSGSFLVKKWGIEFLENPPRSNQQAAPPRYLELSLDCGQTVQKNGNTLVDIRAINETSQYTVRNQVIENGFIFADIHPVNGQLMSIKIPTKVVIPAKNPPENGKLPTTWGFIKHF